MRFGWCLGLAIISDKFWVDWVLQSYETTARKAADLGQTYLAAALALAHEAAVPIILIKWKR
jgi:hypothetical protein